MPPGGGPAAATAVQASTAAHAAAHVRRNRRTPIRRRFRLAVSVLVRDRRRLARQLQRLDDLGEVACARMALAAVDQDPILFRADRLRLPAARAAPAPPRR